MSEKVIKNNNSQKVITTMRRFEMKYILNEKQCDYLLNELANHMCIDEYGLTTIASIYYDTPNFQLIRASIEKPKFKEKIRLRYYSSNKKTYLELKRKFKNLVYKRRIEESENAINKFFSYEGDLSIDGQIAKEIVEFRNHYKTLVPAILIVYDRIAYYETDGDLRLTIDRNLRFRNKDLNFKNLDDGELLLPKGNAVLEIKVQESMPLWLTNILSKGQIYKTSFSKVGEAYKKEMQYLD